MSSGQSVRCTATDADALDSVSGRYMRLTEMAQEFHGTEARGIASGYHFMQKQTVKLNMFLPG